MEISAKYKGRFKEMHEFGLFGLFAKAVCYALQEWPAVI